MNGLNPIFVKIIFSIKASAKVKPNVISLRTYKYATFGDKSHTALDPETWNGLSKITKPETSLHKSLLHGFWTKDVLVNRIENEYMYYCSKFVINGLNKKFS